MNHSNIYTPSLPIPASGGILRRYSSALLLAAFLASLATAQAQLLSFNIIGGPTAVNIRPDNGEEETLRVTGGGQFDALAGSASGSGKFIFKNAEEPGGPIFRGTWVVTGFDSFDSDGGPIPKFQGGTLKVNIELIFDAGFTSPGTLTVVCPFDGVAFDEANDGLEVYVALVSETFTTPPGTAPGSIFIRTVNH